MNPLATLVGLIFFMLIATFMFAADFKATTRYLTASWYGDEVAGNFMANGEIFDPNKLTCASWDYPLGTVLRVTFRDKDVRVIVTDRGPAKRLLTSRQIDLSRAAFERLEELKRGLIEVHVTVLHEGEVAQ